MMQLKAIKIVWTYAKNHVAVIRIARAFLTKINSNENSVLTKILLLAICCFLCIRKYSYECSEDGFWFKERATR